MNELPIKLWNFKIYLKMHFATPKLCMSNFEAVT